MDWQISLPDKYMLYYGTNVVYDCVLNRIVLNKSWMQSSYGWVSLVTFLLLWKSRSLPDYPVSPLRGDQLGRIYLFISKGNQILVNLVGYLSSRRSRGDALLLREVVLLTQRPLGTSVEWLERSPIFQNSIFSCLVSLNSEGSRRGICGHHGPRSCNSILDSIWSRRDSSQEEASFPALSAHCVGPLS